MFNQLVKDDQNQTASRYLVVTPVKDEAQHIASMMKSVIAQTKRPDRWIIVDDGSTDQTPDIIAALSQGLEWITVLTRKPRQRNLGSAEILAFNQGIDMIDLDDFDFIVKLDGDVDLEPHYFHDLLVKMQADRNWGIASGVYREDHDGIWETITMPTYHAAGASKVVARECYKAIGGFVAKKGWDTLDEIRAGLAGWKTGHFEDLVFTHLKPEGIAMGKLSTHRFHGEIYYQTGGGGVFLLFKALHRMLFAKPMVVGGMALIYGYLRSYISRQPRLVNPHEAEYYRKMLNRRLFQPIRKSSKKITVSPSSA
jgi:poly-beta-1,6-N-acetyl-D-glucosamine synthase